MNGQPVALAIFHIVNILSSAEDIACGRLIAAGNQFEQCRLAGSVRPHDTDDLRIFHREISLEPKGLALPDNTSVVCFLQIPDLQHRCVHGYTPNNRLRNPSSSSSSAADPS